MNLIEEIKQRLAKYPGVKWESDSSSVTVFPTTQDGFEVALFVNSTDSYTVHFEGWHEELMGEEEALELFALGLSSHCRLREHRRGNFAYKWTLEFKDENEWVEQGTVGLLLIPFWRSSTVRLLQNDLLKEKS